MDFYMFCLLSDVTLVIHKRAHSRYCNCKEKHLEINLRYGHSTGDGYLSKQTRGGGVARRFTAVR